MRALVKLLAILIFGALVLSPAVAYLGLDPMPGDIAFRPPNALAIRSTMGD